ncbi:MAG: hypoxanthine phosphoribosyltransferase [Sphingomonadales bacterium]|nr:hypoxanthine phosphoribosyltransferase [Sphingomonadales bacterium]
MQRIRVHDKTFVPFLTADQIKERVAEMAMQISHDYRDKKPLLLAVLNGSFMFAADLFRLLTIDAEISFIKIASYQGMRSSGKVVTAIGMEHDLNGRAVILVEDIVDTGKTLHHFIPTLQQQHPASIAVATFLHKPEATLYPLSLQYVGFQIPNRFVVGYGLDYDGLGRNYYQVYQLAPDSLNES